AGPTPVETIVPLFLREGAVPDRLVAGTGGCFFVGRARCGAFRALGHRARLARGRRVVARRSDGGAPGTHGGVPRKEFDPWHARRSATRGATHRVGGDHHPGGGTDRVALPAGHRVRCQGPSGGADAFDGGAASST